MVYIHHVPGRLRISRWAVRHHPDVVVDVRSSLQGIEGVHLVKVAPSTGSLIVQYCRRRLPASQLEHWFQERDLWPEAASDESDRRAMRTVQRLTVEEGGGFAGKLGRKLIGMILEKALERVLIAVLV